VSRPEANGTTRPAEAVAERQPFPWDAFAVGARSMGSTVIGTFCWGLVTGVALVKGGMSSSQALGMLVLVYSGTAQLAALPLMSAGAALGAVWVTALLANLRFVVYSAVVATEFRGLPLARRLALGWMTTDTALAGYYGRGAGGGWEASTGDEPLRVREARFLGTNLAVYAGWSLGSIVGVGLAGLIPDSPRIAYVGVLAIMALIGPMLAARAALGAALAAGTVALIGRDWPWRMGMFAAIAAGIAAAVVLSRRPPSPSPSPSPPADVGGGR
jgi:predicted branched-subunit amino acid permease